MKKVPILTILSHVLAAAALATFFLHVPYAPPILAFLSYFIIVPDMIKFSSNYQYLSMGLASGVGIFVAEAVRGGAFPWIAIGAGLGYVFAMLRLAFFSYFTHTRLLGMEAITLPLSIGPFLLGNILDPAGWWTYVAPAAPILHHAVFAVQYQMEGTKLLRNARKGYNVETGKEAPDFELLDHTNQPVRISSFRGERNVLLLFVRGDWCPHCHMMLRTYQKNVHRFVEKNILLIAVGPDPTGVNRDMVEKLGLDFRLLSDENMAIATVYGIRIADFDNKFATKYAQEGLPLPASFLIDKKGVVRYTSRPDRVGEFLDPNTIFPVLERLEAL